MVNELLHQAQMKIGAMLTAGDLKKGAMPLANIVGALLTLHRREACPSSPQIGHCSACNDGDDCVPWPCATAKLIARALGIEAN
jgi:hypothetical protein